MISFLPVVKMRELGHTVETKHFEDMCSNLGYDSVFRSIAGVFYRFNCDTACPAMFVKLPKKGDEVVPDLRWERDLTLDELVEIEREVYEYCKDRYSFLTISETSLAVIEEDNTILFMKPDFKKGDWFKYGYCNAGKNGVSIPA